MIKSKIFVISGPSGVGKGTIVDALVNNKNLNLYWAKSYTTRKQRPSDKNEEHYIFVDKKKFEKLYKAGEILEKNFYNGNWYGSSRLEIENTLKNGKNVLKEVEVNGALKYKKLYPEAILIFIKADLSDIKNRLITRGQNTDKEIEQRLATAQKELRSEKDYHYTVFNPQGNPDQAVLEIQKIINNNN